MGLLYLLPYISLYRPITPQNFVQISLDCSVLRTAIVARMSVGYHLPQQHILSGRDARGRFCAVTCASLPS